MLFTSLLKGILHVNRSTGTTLAGEHLLIWTATTTGKAKRIRNNSQVTVAAGTARGEVTGPEWAATAIILPADEVQRVYPMLADKYEVMRTQRGEGVILQVTLK
ncbi:MAG TPA: hypothetical protein VNG51_22820 [Ktedonobacteraceae bacterium]|nr:hypothetical protein [Ktedonobacteraceae bacterium]